MKKTLLALACLFCMCGKASAIDWFPIKDTNSRHFSIGLLGGSVGYGEDISSPAIGMSLSVWGVHFDLMGWPRAHGSDTGVKKWEDDRCVSTHLGYQIPVTKVFRVVPMVGYTKAETGTTDGKKWTYNSQSGINNSFRVDDSSGGFDYGAMLVFSIPVGSKVRININLAGTRHALYGGGAVEF